MILQDQFSLMALRWPFALFSSGARTANELLSDGGMHTQWMIGEHTDKLYREMQLFLIGYMLISICEIFTIGGFPLDSAVRRAFTAIHIAAVTATSWILLMNGAVGYQVLDDGTFLSLGLIFGSAAILFVGTGYIALDTGFAWTGFWNDTLDPANQNRSYSIYTLYLLVPLVFIFIFFLLEANLVLRVLGERRPMSECL